MKTNRTVCLLAIVTVCVLTLSSLAQPPPRQQPPTGQQPPHQPPPPQPPPKPPQDTPPLPTKPPEQREPGQPGTPDKGPAVAPDLTLPVLIDSFFDVFPPAVEIPPAAGGAPPVAGVAPAKEKCGFTSKKLLRTVESGWRPKKADAVALPGRDAVVIVTWENDIYNEFEVIGPCPLDKGHGGEHSPKKIVYEKLGTLTETESYPPGTRRPRPPAGTGLPQGGP